MSSISASNSKLNIKSIILCALFAALTAIGGFIKIPIPPVPITLQLFFSILSGIILGSRLGFYSQLIFIFTGLIGFPVFAKGGGLSYIFEPTFGYVLGFAACAFIAGIIKEKIGSGSFLKLFSACIGGLIANYLLGIVYLYFIMNFYLSKATPFYSLLWTGGAIFLPKDAVLCAFAAVIALKLVPILKKSNLI